LAAALGAGAAVLPAAASSETPTVDAVNQGLYGHAWSPAQVAVTAGGAVTLRNSTTVPHGVEWVGGPAKPECSGVPVGTTAAASGVEWSGSCTFSQAGTYTFYCTVHGPEMTGTVTVDANGTTTTTTTSTPTSPGPPVPPVATTPVAPAGPVANAPLLGGLSLRSVSHGESLGGSLTVSQDGAGSRLQIAVLARGESLTRASHAKRVRVGGLTRSSVPAGRVSFRVRLDARARRALHHRRRLALTVEVTLTPPHGKPQTLTHPTVARV
jgi:plastocyanin